MDEILQMLTLHADNVTNRPYVPGCVIRFAGRRGRDLRSAKLIMQDAKQKVYECTNCYDERRTVSVWNGSLTLL